MNKFSFDLYGNLLPHKIIETSLDEIAYNLVETFEISQTRLNLFNQFKEYTTDFSNLIGNSNFEMLIDGSFASRKNNPNDIDLVVIVEEKLIINLNPSEIKAFKCSLEQRKLLDYEGVHAFLVVKYSESHSKHILFQSDFLHWVSFFSKDRKGNDKGILKLNF